MDRASRLPTVHGVIKKSAMAEQLNNIGGLCSLFHHNRCCSLFHREARSLSLLDLFTKSVRLVYTHSPEIVSSNACQVLELQVPWSQEASSINEKCG